MQLATFRLTRAIAIGACAFALSACNVLNLESSSGEGEGALDAIKGFAGRVLDDTSQGGESASATSSPGKTEYFQYTDDRGSVHFVKSMHEVPAKFRDQVGRLEVEKAPPRPKAARTAAKARPFAATAAAPARASVTVYTTPWCGWCRKTVEWLDERGIAYENRDVEASEAYRKELVSHSGGTSVPVVVIDGEVVRGFDAHRMEQLIGRG